MGSSPAYRRAYYQRPEVKERQSAYMATYQMTPERRAQRIKYDATYRKRPDVILKVRMRGLMNRGVAIEKKRSGHDKVTINEHYLCVDTGNCVFCHTEVSEPEHHDCPRKFKYVELKQELEALARKDPTILTDRRRRR